ncbi:MAG: SGNH/GDSL hydrolase family protein [Lysobacteraceae bacterium]|nr:MAG: SGNH/GDSL hydrolase family protein [Xanthomonadaceae bacterium]
MTETFLASTLGSSAELRYLALGDSYTIGEGVPEAGRWPVQLTCALRADGIAVSEPLIIAQTGWTTDELDAGIDRVHPLAEYDLVSLLVGVNNQYRGRSVDEYKQQFEALLERAIGFAQWKRERVLVLSIPDWGVTPFAEGRDRASIAQEIDRFNAAALQACVQRGVAFVDITPASRDGGDAVEMLADDGLHPSAAMYARWTRLALPVAARALAGRL